MTAAFASFAADQFELAVAQDDGLSLREHLLNLERITGKTPQRLKDTVNLPNSLLQLWEDFLELHSSRTGTGFGPSRITFADIDAWQRIRGVVLNGWQVDAIRKADDAFMASLPKPSR